MTQRGHAGPKALSSANRARRRRQRDRPTGTAGGYEEFYAELKRIGVIWLNETSYDVFSIGP
jgi:hypothetical protein